MIHKVDCNGANIPALGLGTWDLRGATCEECVSLALDAGYRHIDTAAMYENEREVGNGMRASSVPREDIFLTTKVWHDSAGDGPLQRSVEDSLKRLDLDYVDLILIHWPDSSTPVQETMKALNDVKARGLARHIGVSNFTIPLLEEAVAYSDEPVATNQVEYHPYLDQSALLNTCRKHGIGLTAYSPLAKGQVFNETLLKKLGQVHGRNAGQIALRWLIQQDSVIAIPRSSKPERIKSALEVTEFTLSDDEMARISALASPNGRMVSFDFSPEWD